MLATVYSRASCGIKAPSVTVETHLTNGLPKFSIVGLPETTIKESKDRVRSALLNSQFEFPIRRITVNLGPADLPKEGGRFDLPIAIGILAASKQIPTNELERYEFAGELALSGELRPIPGILPYALAASQHNRTLILPEANAKEAALAHHCKIIAAKHLLDVCGHLTGRQKLQEYQLQIDSPIKIHHPDISDVQGQDQAKRALIIAAVGGHSLLMFGSPGTGKSMLASRLTGLLPDLNEQQAIEVAAIHSMSTNAFHAYPWRKRPFRAPHHTASSVALVGGGSPPRPGEISLAHHGVLFLDELPEFERRVLEALREPLETGTVTISRAARQAEFPARFQLLAAMNPCPCGYLGDSNGRCHCSPEQVQRYRNRISGPLLDRIDMHIEVNRLPEGVLTQRNPRQTPSSQSIQRQVIATREKQLARQGVINSQLQAKALEQHCKLSDKDYVLLEQAIKRLNLSARSYHRILRVARSIADWCESEKIATDHINEALSYRHFDR